MRRFIHHPTEVPILITPEGSSDGDRASLCNIGDGVIACRLPHELPPGAPVTLSFPSLNQECSLMGRVVKCNRFATGFGVSILFKDAAETFKSKMVEQVCQIEHYRRKLLNEGRALDRETAAHEWIELYSNRFSETLSR